MLINIEERYMDIKPTPRDSYEEFIWWCNRIQTTCVLMVGKKIKVRSAGL